jgi:hypothetical protein
MDAAAEAIQWTPIVFLQRGHKTGEKNISDTEIDRSAQLGHFLSVVFNIAPCTRKNSGVLH